LDGDIIGAGADPNTSNPVLASRSRGYQPKNMRSVSGGAFDYIPTRVNGERLYTGSPRAVWIKIETVSTDATTGAINTTDITPDILSLGVTEEAPSSITLTYSGTHSNDGTPTSPSSNLTATTAQTASTFPDSRSIIKLQRFLIPGPAIPGGNNLVYSFGSGSTAANVVRRYTSVGSSDANINLGCSSGCTAANLDPNSGMERYGMLKRATINGVTNVAIVPFPIEMYDTREGEHYDQASTTYYNDLSKIAANGTMSMIDIDVANLRRFLRGDFNGLFPVDTPFALSKAGTGLVNSDIPQNQGWVLYVSNRRGDADYDGEFDMEDIYGAGKGNDGVMETGEDANGDGILQAAYGTEAEKYNVNATSPDTAAVDDHKYYRRGVRLINGTVIPGIYDSVTSDNTRGFTAASENGIYVFGNYNATGVTSIPATGNTTYDNYLPFNTATHIPASVVADAVTILSNSWDDGGSFASAYDQSNRIASDTTIRFAMLAGNTISSKQTSPDQGGISPRLNGGIHNFKRYLERWTDPGGSFSTNLNYAGSLISLFNSRNNTGSFKCCGTVYNPPVRNWVFDATFLDPGRLPPGTPYFQYVQTTGFQRTNN
jgi:hypothetical protein